MFNPNVVVKNIVESYPIHTIVNFAARALLAYLFIISGYEKITAYAATVSYMEAMGVPSGLLPLVILLELGGGLAILFGFQTRIVALVFVAFNIISALMFHSSPEDAVNFMKNFAIAGGFLALVLQGAGRFSLDFMIEKK